LAVIIGGSNIGLGMAEAFTARGLTVKLVEQAPAVMPTIDIELGQLLGEELHPHSVQVVKEVTVKAIHREHDGLVVVGGTETGVRGAVRVDRRMRTNLAEAPGRRHGARRLLSGVH
jgi:pyruvate/2-oxoglutarate dehydrogenase complex dihydrolipoamide dehydrogenase (E3) component